MATLLSHTTSKGAGNYVGETKKQLRDGFGVYNYSNKFFRYEGEWSKGKKHGHGKLVMADGSFYEGQFIDGEIQGHGFRRWAVNRNEYTGQFVKGEMNGHGIMLYGDGFRYEGEWATNQREGDGKLSGKDGSVYEGSFHKHKRHGEGRQLYSNGDIYEGDWVNDLKQGHGIMKFADGTIYGGQWWGDVFNGEGSMIHVSGASYEGIWINGRPEVEACQIRIVGDEHIEFMQGRPFGFEVDCVTADREPTQDEGRLLQVTAGVKVGTGRKCTEDVEKELDTLMTPFGFEIEPYPLTEMMGEISSDALLGMTSHSQAPSAMSNRQLPGSPPTGEELNKAMDHLQVNEGSDSGDKEGSVVESHADVVNRTAAPSQASTLMTVSLDKPSGFIGEGSEVIGVVPSTASLPPPVAPVRTAGGNALLENLYLPPLPPGIKPFNSFDSLKSSMPDMTTTEESQPTNNTRGSKGAALNPNNLLKVVNRNLASSAMSEAGKRKKDSLADVVEKADGKRKKDKKETEKDDKFCKPGDYVIIVEDVTSPPFLDVLLAPAFLHVKVTQKKRARSKMESRRQ